MAVAEKSLEACGFFWSDEVDMLDGSLENALNALVHAKTEKEKEFFRNEYMRILGLKTEAIRNWLAVW